jgi:dipeptidyl aminopeptidase/acylaminoacyl peptidase
MHFFKNLLWTIVMIGSTNLVNAAPNAEAPSSENLIPRQLLFGNPEKASPVLSPNGSQLAYLAPDANNVLNVWVRNLKQTVPDRQITNDKKRGIRNFRWQLDNQHILYIQDKEGDENWHLYQTDLKSLVTKDLTPYDNVKVNTIDTDVHYPNEILIQMNKRNPELFDVYRYNLQTGELKVDTENPGGVFGWIIDHQLQVRGSQAYNPDGSTLIRLRENAQASWADWMTISPLEMVDIEDFTADNQSVYLMTSVGNDTTRLFQVDLKTGQKNLIAEDPTYDLSDVIINPITYQLEAIGVEREKYEWMVKDPEMKKDFDFLANKLKGVFHLSSRDLSNQLWVVASQSDVRPTHYYLFNRATKALNFLFSTQPALEKYKMSPRQPITFQARDGLTLHGYLTLPIGKEASQLPTILMVHGGPWARDSWGLDSAAQWMANRGYAVLQINFRGSTGYGKSFLNAGNREWAGKMHTDLLDGKAWLVGKGIADPKKVAIYGGSYGGYATLVGLTFTPDEFCCGVDIVGPSNLLTLLKTFPAYWAPLMSQMNLRVGNLETDAEFLKARSPLFKVDQIKKPLLIGQGANDPRVKQAESDQIVSAMREKNLPVEYLLFPDEGHGFAQPNNRLKFYAATESFLARYLGGRQELPKPEENWEAVKR